MDWTHRHGSLHLTLVLPDGTRSLIPAVWTDLDQNEKHDVPSGNPQSVPRLIGSISHLLHARKIVDALLRKRDSPKQISRSAPKEESNRAKTTSVLARSSEHISKTPDLGQSESPAPRNPHHFIGQTDQQNGSVKGPQRNPGGQA